MQITIRFERQVCGNKERIKNIRQKNFSNKKSLEEQVVRRHL